MLRAVIFDLDGVLVDSLPSIHRCMNFALVQMGRMQVDENEIRTWIGPPLELGAAALLDSQNPTEIARFVGYYRQRYEKTCGQESLAAEGLKEVLVALENRKLLLAVATSKPEQYARIILDELEALPFFRTVCGRSLALDHEEKSAVIARVFRYFSASGANLDPTKEAIMVGDRKFDVHGAAHHKMQAVGVLHGMGSKEELLEAGAKWIVPNLRGLVPLIDRLRF